MNTHPKLEGSPENDTVLMPTVPNAIDYLELAAAVLDLRDQTALKHAINSVFFATELVIKELLERIDPGLVYVTGPDALDRDHTVEWKLLYRAFKARYYLTADQCTAIAFLKATCDASKHNKTCYNTTVARRNLGVAVALIDDILTNRMKVSLESYWTDQSVYKSLKRAHLNTAERDRLRAQDDKQRDQVRLLNCIASANELATQRSERVGRCPGCANPTVVYPADGPEAIQYECRYCACQLYAYPCFQCFTYHLSDEYIPDGQTLCEACPSHPTATQIRLNQRSRFKLNGITPRPPDPN